MPLVVEKPKVGRETNRVGDDKDVGIGRGISSSLGEVADDRGVGVEEV